MKIANFFNDICTLNYECAKASRIAAKPAKSKKK